MESTFTKYRQDILRQEELKSLIHVPLLECVSKIIYIYIFLSLWYSTEDSKSGENESVPYSLGMVRREVCF